MIAYCLQLVPADMDAHRETCKAFVECTKLYMPDYAHRLKVHLLLHLVDCIIEFGPPSSFNTERFFLTLLFVTLV